MRDDMRPESTDHPAAAHHRSTPSRRTVLATGALCVAAAGAGVGAGVVATRSAPRARSDAEATLRAAVAAERALITAAERAMVTALDAAAHPAASLRPLLRQVRADHIAHLAALQAALVLAGGGPNPAPSRPVATNRAPLRTLEQRAAARAAARAALLDGRDAVLLASIAACEASHAQLLS